MKKNITRNTVKKNWYIVDCSNHILGRLATKLAIIIRGKNKEEYCPNLNIGDYLILINVNKIRITGNKKNTKFYYHHTGYSGGIKKIKYSEMLLKKPEKIILQAVKGMLPKNKISNTIIKKLKIYYNENHFHKAQNPIMLDLK